MRVLGIHDGHNASACLLEDGKILYCIQEERLTNKKNMSGLPVHSIKTILSLADIGIDDIEQIAVASEHCPLSFNVLESYRSQSNLIKSKFIDVVLRTPVYNVYKRKIRKQRIKRLTDLNISADRISFVDHHLCHAAAAYYGSPWKYEKVLVLTNDGSGDGLCATVYIGENGRLSRISATKGGNSLGDIYGRVTFYLGLVPWEHEWKIMGMAAYALENGMHKSYDIFSKYLNLPDGSLQFKRNIPEPTHLIYSRLKKDLELHRFDWISAGVQRLAEELLCQWVRNAIRETGIRRLSVSGGVFMNVKANKKIMEIDGVDDLFVFPSCGDESNSIGAAYWTYAEECRRKNINIDIEPLGPIYFGPSFNDEDIKKALAEYCAKFQFEFCENIEKRTAELVADGEIVARCKGPMEFGARALGNRSILADPINYDCVRIINRMVKKRDFWMPFAPVVLKERAVEYLKNPKGFSSPYMMLSMDTTEKRSEFMAAVHQADLTARPQIIGEEWNPDYYRVLKEFEKITGRGVLLNTSFNLHGYPMVCGPKQALWVFENSKLDYLALGNYLVSR